MKVIDNYNETERFFVDTINFLSLILKIKSSSS